MTRLFLLRHGETAHNLAGRTIASTDPPLTARGLAQADAVGRALASIPLRAIVTSPRIRCIQTAEAIGAAQTGGVEPIVDERLVELGMGAFEGRSRSELVAQGLGEVFDGWRQGLPPAYPEGAERFEDAAVRMRAALDDACADGGDVAVVGHSHSLRIALATWVLGVGAEVHRRMRLDHGTLTEIGWEGTTPRVAVLNAPVPLWPVPPSPEAPAAPGIG